jgi:hypothetical protein
MTAGIALLAFATLVVPVCARAIRIVRGVRAGVDERLGHRKLRPLLDPRAQVVSAAGRRSPIPLPDLVFHVLVIAAVVCQYSTIVLYVLPRA